MKKLLSIVLLLFCGLAFGQVAQIQAFNPNGNSVVTFTGNTSGSVPTPVQATGCPSNTRCQYILTNIGVNNVFVGYGTTAAVATANSVIPTGTATIVVPLLASSQIIITTDPNAYFTGITASGTSVVYVQAGAGL